MDDQSFNQKDAEEWIQKVENPNGPREGDIYPLLRSWVEATAPIEILEIGCGQGICSDKIDLRGRRYTGVEPSPFLLDRAKQLYRSENRKFVRGSAYELPFQDRTFDAVFSVAVWHLLGDLQKATAEFGRALKEGGHFLLITANPKSQLEWENISSPGDVLHFHSLDSITDSFKTVGLNAQTVKTLRSDLFLCVQGQKTKTL